MTLHTDLPLHVPPTVAAETGARDVAAATRAADDFLAALGIAADTESTRRTPERMAQAFVELLTPASFDLTTFPNERGYRQLVLERNVAFTSLCEHHMMPFHGSAYVAYLPGNRMLGLSKLARVVELFARRPQVQEAMTQQIADWLHEHLAPAGVGVVIEAEHTCMTLRGARAVGSSTITSALHGVLLDDARAREEFFTLAGVHT